MTSWISITVSKLYNAISAPMAATRDALAERLQSVRETASLLYNRMMENMKYGRERLKDITEKEAEEEEAKGQEQEEEEVLAAAKEQQQDDDDGQHEAVAKIKLVYEGKRVKEFRVTGNLNKANARMIVANITLHTEMRTKVIYSFKSEIHRGAGEIVPYHKILTSPPGMFTGLGEIQAYIKECEQKQLDLDNKKV